MRRFLQATWGVLLAAGLFGCAALPKQIADYGSAISKMDRVVVLPPEFQVSKAGTFSSESQAEMNHDVAQAVQGVMEQLVTESRYKLARLETSDSALIAKPELRQRLGENAKAVDAAFTKIVKTKGRVLNVEFHGNIDYLADQTGADYFLMVGGGGWFKSTGTKVAQFLLFGARSGPGSMTTLRAMLVDANRGKVVWYNQVMRPNMDPRKPSQLMQTAQQLMKPLLGKSALKPDTSHDRDIIEKFKNRERAELVK